MPGGASRSRERQALLRQPPAPPGQAPVAEEKKRIGPMELPLWSKVGLLAGVWLATSLASLNMTMVATLMSSISSEFGRSNQSAWIGTSFLLATTAFSPLYGRLCNIMGRKWANLTALTLFGVGTAMCGSAQSLEALIVARFLAGIGGGGLGITSSVIAADLFSLRQRSLIQGLSSVFNGAGMGLGGPFGGYMADRFGWRWAFLAQLPFFAVSFVLSVYYNNYYTPGKGHGAWDMLKRIDYAGSATLLIAVLNLLLMLSYKYNSEMPFVSVEVLLTFSLFVVFTLLFLYTQFYVSAEPVLSRKLLKMFTPTLVGINNFLVAMCNFGVTYHFPMWFETVALTTSAEAGLHLLPNSIASSAGSLFAGWVMSRTGKYRMLSLIFGIVPTIAAALIAALKVTTPPIWQWLVIAPLGFGNAVVFQTTLIALLASVDQNDIAVGTGFVSLFRCVGQVSGVAFGSAIFQSVLFTELKKRITGPGAADTIASIRHNSKLVISLPQPLQNQARDSYAYALRAVFIFCAVCTFVSFVVRIPMPEHSLDDPPTESTPNSDDSDNSDDDSEALDTASEADEAHDEEAAHEVAPLPPPTPAGEPPFLQRRGSRRPSRPMVRRFSTFETGEGYAAREERATTTKPGSRSFSRVE